MASKFKRFINRVFAEDEAAAGKRAETKRAGDTAKAIAKLKREVGANDRPDGLLGPAAGALEDKLRAAFDRPDKPLTPARLDLITKAMREREKLLDAIPERTRKRLIVALYKQIKAGKRH
ncbi:MAG: hypothetical protein FJX61_14825 [Alphaproteobacteria bacterium]|nr:hypothetical protein [Alphaproteobacteria bacterium]